jgi:hypothetical protein
MLEKAKLLNDVNGARRSFYSLRHTYATFQIIYNRLDLHTLAKNMGTSIAMVERHYSHLEVLHRAEALAGKAEQPAQGRRVRETRIIELGENFEESRSPPAAKILNHKLFDDENDVRKALVGPSSNSPIKE